MTITGAHSGAARFHFVGSLEMTKVNPLNILLSLIYLQLPVCNGKRTEHLLKSRHEPSNSIQLESMGEIVNRKVTEQLRFAVAGT